MENYYTDKRVQSALEKSSELMDILTFVKEINFEIKDNLGFDVLWDSMTSKRYIYIYISLLEWLGYSGPKELQKQAFINLLDRNNIIYKTIGYQDPLVLEFSQLQEEIQLMRPVDKPRKRWIVMETTNFKKAIMRLNTARREDIQDYYFLLEELVQLYGAYTTQFKEKQLNDQIQAKDDQIQSNLDHILLLKDLLIDDQKREKTQVLYIATSQNYARQNRFKVGGVENTQKLDSRLSVYNSRSASGDEWYYSDTFLVADYHQIESRLKDLLGRFRDKKSKEIYILHYSNIKYICEYLSTHYNDEIDEVNQKLTEFISNLNSYQLRPIVPPPICVRFANITTLKEDGTTTSTTLQSKSKEDFINKLTDYIHQLDECTTQISKKKVFDDLKVKKDRKDKYPVLKNLLSQLRPDVVLKLKE
ncbi:hypothetical protein IIV22_144R [Invertebrate iridescent virus 22]|uniref:MSV199 domain-containing protein n=1 Tax=Invertebrate iridescent virus 22 TaxID=345198 RepID=S6DB04_9VIRU|nr:hypothetical protein IIV22_144R [Invertebrate iridescent virus 22]CCV01821.1 hypothetical protein IIV22_144R [Invertebrate iridescent virus 22]